MSTGVSFTLEQDGQKSGGAMSPPVWKVEGPLAPLAFSVPSSKLLILKVLRKI